MMKMMVSGVRIIMARKRREEFTAQTDDNDNDYDYTTNNINNNNNNNTQSSRLTTTTTQNNVQHDQHGMLTIPTAMTAMNSKSRSESETLLQYT